MWIHLLLLVVGVVAVLWGADRFTDGASSLALWLRVPQIVVGLTVVAFGTSAPELFVSLLSALNGSSGLAVGNVVGSNIFNALLIVGCSAVVMPMAVPRSTLRADIPFAVAVSVLLVVLCNDGRVSRIDALLLLALFVLFMVYTLRLARTGRAASSSPASEKPLPATWKCIALIVLGLACLVVGSHLFVTGAQYVARALGVSEAVIGLTVVAGGTSLPELATSVVSARKGQSALAIGNVVGSNIFNILLIVGLTGTVRPMQLEGLTVVDWAMLVLSTTLVGLFALRRQRITRIAGLALLLLFLVYMGWLIRTATLA